MGDSAAARGVRTGPSVLLVLLVTGCGLGQPTPARFRPPLPEAVAMPDLVVEEVVEQVEALGYACRFSPESDIPAGWDCLGGDQASGDWTQISFAAQATGPIERVFAYRNVEVGPDVGPDQQQLDREGASLFDALIEVIVPEEHRPTDAELLDGVQRNFPMELGGGWFIGFDRSQASRTLHIVYANDPRSSRSDQPPGVGA